MVLAIVLDGSLRVWGFFWFSNGFSNTFAWAQATSTQGRVVERSVGEKRWDMHRFALQNGNVTRTQNPHHTHNFAFHLFGFFFLIPPQNRSFYNTRVVPPNPRRHRNLTKFSEI